MNNLLSIQKFLGCDTPDEWIALAIKRENTANLLIDHCNCELKAAQSALYLMRKYALDVESAKQILLWSKPYENFVYHPKRNITHFLEQDRSKTLLKLTLNTKTDSPFHVKLVDKMMRLVKEEFHHFEQVLQLMNKRHIAYQNLHAGKYAKTLLSFVRTYEPAALVDRLIIGAFIEARSCERFSKLAPYLDNELSRFYQSLLRSEARHYQDYLSLASFCTSDNIEERITFWREKEAQLIVNLDDEFRFHSGIPTNSRISKNVIAQ